MNPTELAEPDPRWQNLVRDRAALEDHAAGWPVSPAIPEGVAEVLRVSRQLFVHSYFVYEFSLAAVTWGLLALEASLRGCLNVDDDRQSLRDLIQLAIQRGFVTAEEATALDGARRLRNQIVHGSLLATFAPSAAARMLEGIHEAVSDLCGRAALQRA